MAVIEKRSPLFLCVCSHLFPIYGVPLYLAVTGESSVAHRGGVESCPRHWRGSPGTGGGEERGAEGDDDSVFLRF